MKIPILGFDPPRQGPPTAPATDYGYGLLSRALAPPDSEYERRHRMLERYLEKRAGFIHAGTTTVH